MKYCPTCDTRYDEEILRFCMKDGTPLVEEEEPTFIQMPSESVAEPDEDDIGEITVIRKNTPSSPPLPPPQSLIDDISFAPDPQPSHDRIVVPTADEQPHLQPSAVRPRVIPPYQPVSQPPNTTKVVVLTIIGTIAAMALGAFGFWFLQNDRTDTNVNINTNFNNSLENVNTNLNTNVGLDSNFNFNMNANFNSNSLSNINANFNANMRTPSPTPTPRPSPSVTPTASPTPDADGTPAPTRTPAPPAASPTPIVIRPTPPRMAPMPTNRPAANRLDG